MPGHWNFVALALYLASLGLYLRFLYTGRRLTGQLAALALGLGLAGHYLALVARSHSVHSVPYNDLHGSLSLFGWLLGATYLGLELYYHQRAMGAFVVPFIVLLYTLGTWPGHAVPATTQERGALFALHVTLSILAYAAFALAFVVSGIYLLQDRRLRRHSPGDVVWRFPALDGLERMSRGSVLVGLVSLGAGVALGLIWQRRIQGHFQIADPKVLVTVLMFALYAGYLRVSHAGGWRGARASLLCLLNFLIVIFSYAVVNVYLSRFHRYY
ncbi:MAG TPA: cytochrome c biogenesis protein CcsA [Candidatus Acidoferrales bacterium]|nr:cytochrome c biogenesis protein CcsA [Candidatus Acidoferrales bacterium]